MNKLFDLTKEADDAAVGAEWPRGRSRKTVAEMAKELGVKNITSVDPGLKHCAVTRFQLFPTFQLTHFSVLNLHDLCEKLQEAQPGLYFEPSTKTSARVTYPSQSLVHALQWHVGREMESGGSFDSDMLFVEAQDFEDQLDMRNVERGFIDTFQQRKPPIKVHSAQGGTVPAARRVSGRSRCACFGGFFRSIDKTKSAQPPKKRARFNNKKKRGNPTQYRLNKKSSATWGTVVAPIALVARQLGDNFTAEDRRRIQQLTQANKLDDIYDAFWTGMYAVNAYVSFLYTRKAKFILKPLDGFKAPTLRAGRQFEEVHEFMVELGVSDKNIMLARKALLGE